MKTILIVDDEDDIRYSVVSGIKMLNSDLEFVEAQNGKIALDKIKSYKIDLILLDVMMPVMDGWALAGEVKSKPEYKDIPIIFLTAKSDDLSKGMGLLTAQDYIEKPFKLDDLNQRIKKLI